MSVLRFGPARWAGAMLLAWGGMTAGAAAWAQAADVATSAAALQGDAVRFDIPAQDLGAALAEYGRQSGQELFFAPEVVVGKTATPVNGTLSRQQAIDQLLQGTALEYLFTPDGGLMVGEPASIEQYKQRLLERGAASGGAGVDDTSALYDDSVDITPAQGGTTSVEVARRGNVEEIIVTGQKKAERLQDVPIAISAFSMEDLDAQKIEGGFDLLKGVPNVTFSKTNFTGYNFQIRGIGTQAVSAATDPGVAVSFNNTTLIVNRLFEQEYLDIERVEVLRGPQGTLFGRNATSGVINVISAKPVMGLYEGEIKVEGGNYSARRVRGHYNFPLNGNETLAARIAYASTERDGFGYNEFDGSDVDNRDLWTSRISLGWQPNEALRFNLLWERFEEDDNRVRTSKQLCHRDPGPEFIGALEVAAHPVPLVSPGGIFSQGCLPGSLYSADAYSAPNGNSLPFVFGSYFASILAQPAFGGLAPSEQRCPTAQAFPIATVLTFCEGIDPYGNRQQSRDLRRIYSQLEPRYKATADIVELSLDIDLSDALLFSSQSVYVTDEYYATQDFNRFETNHNIFFNSSADGINAFYADFSPGGIFHDPQLGPSDQMIIQDLAQSESRQFNQEFRMVSAFAGNWNFSTGINFTRFETTTDYYIFSNLVTAIARSPLYRSPNSNCVLYEKGCIYIDPNELANINGEGHNYFRSNNPYELTSSAIFGELYWQMTETLKLTAGLRWSWDKKRFSPVPSQTLLYDYLEMGNSLSGAGFRPYFPPSAGPEVCLEAGSYNECPETGNAPGGRGYPANPDIIQEWREPTGRLVLNWQPLLDFTDETLIYLSLSRGYKGGGANPPTVAPPSGLFIAAARESEASETFDPEYINAIEIGTKNTLLNGAVILNGAAFYYDYSDYQVSKIVDRSAANENFDATVWGLELETVFAPTLDLQFNAAIGFLQTRIANGERSIDVMNRTQGGNLPFTTADGHVYDNWMVIKPWIHKTSNCVVPVEIVEALYSNGGSVVPGAPCLGGTYAGLDYLSTEDGGDDRTVPGTAGWTEHASYDDDPDHIASDPGIHYNPLTDAPNGGAGFFADLSGNELPNAPHWTVSLGAQYGADLSPAWRLTSRVDWYWQGESYARVYNTEYDRLKAWNNTNLSFWARNEQWALTIEAYVKNVFDETPITGTFLNADDSALSTNVFTLDPRLFGISLRKEF